MNYHNITYPDQNNGDGLRVCLWVSGCNHHCRGCQNSQTWDTKSGIVFDNQAQEELFIELRQDYISGLTLTGGDPLHTENVDYILKLLQLFREEFDNTKTVWIYTGFTYEEIIQDTKRFDIVKLCDVLVDGMFVDYLKDNSLEYRGSSNQRLIDVKKSIIQNQPILYEIL